jgi:hypothetical protein
MHQLSSKSNQYLVVIFFTTLIFMFFIFYLLHNINHNKELINRLENTLFFSKEMLNNQQQYALSLSILLSQDQEIIQSFLVQDVTQSFNIVNRKIKHLKKLQNIDFEVQIHNKNLSTYLRNWDISKRNIPLESFRKGVVKVHKDKRPHTSIEVGKRLNIKAISPIFNDNEFIGSLEVIIGFENLTHAFKQKGYELFVLMHKDFLSIATKLKNNPIIDDFVVVNNNNQFMLDGISLHDLQDYGYISNEQYAFSYFSYYDLNNNKIGYIFSGFPNEYKLNVQQSLQYDIQQMHILKKEGL